MLLLVRYAEYERPVGNCLPITFTTGFKEISQKMNNKPKMSVFELYLEGTLPQGIHSQISMILGLLTTSSVGRVASFSLVQLKGIPVDVSPAFLSHRDCREISCKESLTHYFLSYILSHALQDQWHWVLNG